MTTHVLCFLNFHEEKKKKKNGRKKKKNYSLEKKQESAHHNGDCYSAESYFVSEDIIESKIKRQWTPKLGVNE